MPIIPTDFSYNLPAGLIANEPVEPRDHCRLLVVDRNTKDLSDRYFYELADLLTSNDVLVLNQSKVFPARIFGRKLTGGKFEILLIHQNQPCLWTAISRPLLKTGQELEFDSDLRGIVRDSNPLTGQIEVEFFYQTEDFFKILDRIGQFPLPPYIRSQAPQELIRQQYQSVFARETGSAAAPTAGLHFTSEMLEKLKAKGVQVEYVTLHVGLGTFQPLRPENIKTGKLHSEFYEISQAAADRLNLAKKQGKRIIAVGTTSVRTLESAVKQSADGKSVVAGTGNTELFIYPPYKFRFVDSLITNFHLPESSLLMLVAAFASSPNSRQQFTSFNDSLIAMAYRCAVEKEYRFFSFGDAMWIKG